MIFDGKAELWRDGGLEPLRLRNRTMRSATWEGLADAEGRMTPALAEAMAALARGGVGLVTFSHTTVAPEGQASPRQLGIYTDAQAASLRPAVAAVHAAGALCSLQLSHGGRLALPTPAGAVGPSDVPLATATGVPLRACRAATAADLDAIVAAFAAGAARAARAGFDCVTVHAAHGYLLSEFLSPLFNCRTDAYGGALENRARLLRRVVAACRAALGPAVPVLVKLNTEDFAAGGLAVAESAQVACWLAADGAALVEASGGSPVGRCSGIRTGAAATPAYHAAAARAWRDALHAAGLGRCRVALVGGLRGADACSRLVADGVCDIVALSRPLIREPDLVLRWQADPHYVAKCISCSACHAAIKKDQGYFCPVARSQTKKDGEKDS